MAPHHQDVGAELVGHMADDGPGVPDSNLHLDLHLMATLTHLLQQANYSSRSETCENEFEGGRPLSLMNWNAVCVGKVEQPTLL